MTIISIRSLAMLLAVSAALSGCSSHCTCPPQPAAAAPTTVIQEPSR